MKKHKDEDFKISGNNYYIYICKGWRKIYLHP